MSGAPMPPYGALIEEAREKARLSRREAGRRAGISGNWWRYVVDGYQGETPVRGSAETVAAMARVVGLSPERLESEGQRPDAAEALRSQPEPPRPSAVPDLPPPLDLATADDAFIETVIEAWQETDEREKKRKEIMRAIWNVYKVTRSGREEAVDALTAVLHRGTPRLHQRAREEGRATS